MESFCAKFGHRLTRRKYVNWNTIHKTSLARCLTTLDLTALGIGSTLGAGAYVIAGQVAKSQAGPAVVISFLIAAIASILAGLCYAEFGARVPKTGSAYVFTYVTVGEGLAFVIGWNLLLEYVIGSASVARTFSGYFDFLVGDQIVPFFNSSLHMNVNSLAEYADPLAMGIIFLVTAILIVGVRESATVNKIFTGLNLTVLSYIIISGAFKDDARNWNIQSKNITGWDKLDCSTGGAKFVSCGTGGFAPYGFSGIVGGAATAFYAFVGFDAIATTGEEAKNPSRDIPISIITSLLVVFVFYFGLSLTVTMMEPYYMLDNAAPIARAFEYVGWKVATYIVTVGAICALSTSLLGAMFPMPRVVMAMARDGVIFRFLGFVHPKLKTPIWATLLSGLLAGVMAFIFDVNALVNMMSIGTLLAYTLVSVCVMLLRYDMQSEDHAKLSIVSVAKPLRYSASVHASGVKYEPDDKELTELVRLRDCPNELAGKRVTWISPTTMKQRIMQLLFPPLDFPTPFSASAVKLLCGLSVIEIIGIGAIFTLQQKSADIGVVILEEGWGIFLLVFVLVLTVGTLILIKRQPESSKKLSFRTPLVPFFPAVSIFFNLYLMMQLDVNTWIRFGVWMAIGALMYFGYGMLHSNEELGIRDDEDEENEVEPTNKDAANGGVTNGASSFDSVASFQSTGLKGSSKELLD